MTGHPPQRKRRAASLASAVLVLAVANAMIVSTLTGGSDDAFSSQLRIDALRASVSAESGIALVIGEFNAGRPVPAGQHSLADGQLLVIEIVDEGDPMIIDVTGSSGRSSRTRRITLDGG